MSMCWHRCDTLGRRASQMELCMRRTKPAMVCMGPTESFHWREVFNPWCRCTLSIIHESCLMQIIPCASKRVFPLVSECTVYMRYHELCLSTEVVQQNLVNLLTRISVDSKKLQIIQVSELKNLCLKNADIFLHVLDLHSFIFKNKTLSTC